MIIKLQKVILYLYVYVLTLFHYSHWSNFVRRELAILVGKGLWFQNFSKYIVYIANYITTVNL